MQVAGVSACEMFTVLYKDGRHTAATFLNV